jgi:hypothetical protein
MEGKMTDESIRPTLPWLYDVYDRELAENSIWDKIEPLVNVYDSEEGFGISAYKTKKQGKAVWILAGIHGEEPAGPVGIAYATPYLRNIDIPVVVIPVCDPLSYTREERPTFSMTDASAFMFPNRFRVQRRDAYDFYRSIEKLAEKYKPELILDLHEDDLAAGFYSYIHGTSDIITDEIIRKFMSDLFSKYKVTFEEDENTRLGEPIIDGIVRVTNDGSIDTYMNKKYGALSVVFETPSAELFLKDRASIDAKFIEQMMEKWIHA